MNAYTSAGDSRRALTFADRAWDSATSVNVNKEERRARAMCAAASAIARAGDLPQAIHLAEGCGDGEVMAAVAAALAADGDPDAPSDAP